MLTFKEESVNNKLLHPVSLSTKNKSELHDVDIIAHSEPILNQIPLMYVT